MLEKDDSHVYPNDWFDGLDGANGTSINWFVEYALASIFIQFMHLPDIDCAIESN